MALGDLAAPLWPHQEEAIEAACQHLAEGGRATQVLACGAGKTKIGAHVVAVLAPGERRLVFAPTVMLLSQLWREYRATLGDAVLGRVLLVCSADQPSEGDRAGLDDLATDQVCVTTDPDVIAAVVSGPGPVTVFSTYASAPTLARAHREHRVPPWDVVIGDEAHRTVAGKIWPQVNDDARLPARRRLFMTATPRRLTGRAGMLDVVGMDDERVFGPTIYRFPYAQAIDLGLLAGYRVVASVISDHEIRALATDPGGHTALRVGRAVIPAPMLAAQIALLRATSSFGLTRAISYHNAVANAQHFASTLPAVADLLPVADQPARIWARHVHGGHTASVREGRLAKLAEGVDDGLAVLSNARLLSEGVDVPAVDAVLFADPRRSTTDIVQAIGRAVRLGGQPGKVATIIIPLLITVGSDPDTAIADSAFASVWQVVRALRSHDEDLAAELDRIRCDKHLGGGTPRLNWLHVDGIEVTPAFAEAISVRVVESATSSWEEYYGACIAYHKEHGHLAVKESYVTNKGLRLGAWLSTQRTRRNAGKLERHRTERLEQLGIPWHYHDAAWERAYAAAVEFKQKNGHVDISRYHITEDGINLGQWLAKTRYKAKKLSDYRRRRLNELGITWSVPNEKRKKRLQAAEAYHNKYGHLNVPSRYVTEDGIKLGYWLTYLRPRRETIDEEERRRLDELGMIWT